MVKRKTKGRKSLADIFGLSQLFPVALEEEEEVTHVTAMSPKAFKPNGSPSRFDLDKYKHSFELWHQQWTIFLVLSNIDFLLDERPAYKTNILLSCFLKETLQQILRWVSQDCDSEIS